MNGEIDCIYTNRPVRMTDSGHAHILRENIPPMTLCDMINQSFPCPEDKRRKFRKNFIELCANRKGRIYRIVLVLDYTYSINVYTYLVIHVEPI